MTATLAPRLARVVADFGAATTRLVARLESASDVEAVQAPVQGAWSPAQIGRHVAIFNALMAEVVSGARPGAHPAPADFVERAWADIQATLGGPLDAPAGLHPPADTTRSASLAALHHAAEAVVVSFSTLSEARAALTFSHPRVGTISLPQVGDWLVAHTIRHNAQLKRVLGR